MNQCKCEYHTCQQGRNCIQENEDEGDALRIVEGAMNALLISFALIVIGIAAYSALAWMGLV